MFGYATDLRSMTQGRASSSMEPSHYEEVPSNVMKAIVEKNAVAEARRLSIPVIAMLDTDADPTEIDLPIPANDDALKSIQMIMKAVADALIEGRERQNAASAVDEKEKQEIMNGTID